MNSAGYNEGRKILEIEFSSSEVYDYFDVPKKLFVGLLNAESAGKFFNKEIKQAGFRFQKIS